MIPSTEKNDLSVKSDEPINLSISKINLIQTLRTKRRTQKLTHSPHTSIDILNSVTSSPKALHIRTIPSSDNLARPPSKCSYVSRTIPLIFKTFWFKMKDHLLLGGEHTQKISPGFDSPASFQYIITEEDKKDIVLSDPKFGMFSLFRYHIKKGYLNKELKKSNKIYCSHIFSLVTALPILIFIAQWILYIALIMHEVKSFDGNFCPAEDTIENKMMIAGISILYFVRSFFMWDNLTTRTGLQKMNRVDSICTILDTFQEFSFNLLVYSANIWIVFVEDDLKDMILNSLAMEFLMTLDNEFEEFYFQNLPGSAEDIYDNIFVNYKENKKLLERKRKESCCFSCFSYVCLIPYKLLVVCIFFFPLFCLFMIFAGPICK
tara:strand:- start:486 stop:1616 length:1131 start_codon:yes stop_codon:yes gene_type:complete